jgi:hypothetical protein
MSTTVSDISRSNQIQSFLGLHFIYLDDGRPAAEANP